MENEEEFYDVVISGISGRYPSADNLEELKERLLEKRNLVTDENCRWNKEKWNVPSATGKIKIVEKFDDTFFGIYSGVAAMMDPLTRVTIERAYEAVMDAGYNPKTLRGGNTGVYTASSISDSEAVGCDEKLVSKFWLLAHVRALLANRISYVLNLQGPSWTIDSTWIGGIECLKEAVNSIRKGRIENAIVGVSSVITFPDISQHWIGLGKLSPDGSCRSFEETANGYGRSEGVVFLFLQRADEAKRIYAKINGVDATFCGDQAHTLMKPKRQAFVEFLKKFYNEYNEMVKNVAFLEADGSGDKYLDETELNAVGDVLCDGKRDDTLKVGAIKTNLGHSEAAACLVSLAKTILVLDSGIIPPNNNIGRWNSNIEKLKSKEIEIVTKPSTFTEGKLAAVNSVGVCSSIGHILLGQNAKTKNSRSVIKQLPRLVLLSARHEPGILEMIDKLESMPYDEEYFSLVNDVFKENTTGHFFRGFTILGSSEKKIHFSLETTTSSKRPVWFVFAGMGSQWPGMGADLMNLPIFAESIMEIDKILTPFGIDIVDVVSNFDPLILKNIVHSFVGIAAIQIALVDVLYAAGIKPDGMFGHSLGENACAYADGCFDKYQAIMAAYYRGQASSEVPLPKGLMAAVGMKYDKLPKLPENVQVACHNSPDNTTISGPREDVEKYIEELKLQNIFVRIVNSNFVAYHSKQVNLLAPYVLENVRKLVPNPKKRSSRWISTSIPQCDWNSDLAQTSSADYHVHNFLNTVYFAEACDFVPEDAAVIEISPHGLFQGILKRTLHESCFILPLGKRETSSPLNFLLSSIGKLYVVGLQVEPNALYPPIEYPVSRGTPSLAPLATWNHEKDWELNTYYDHVKIKPLYVSLKDQKWRYLTGYQVDRKPLIPAGLLLVETLKTFETTDSILIFESVRIQDHVRVSANDSKIIYTQVQEGSGNFEVTCADQIIMTGVVRYSQESISSSNELLTHDDNYLDDFLAFSGNEINEMFRQYSMEFSENMSTINRVVCTDEGCETAITWNGNLIDFINTLMHVKLFYDLCTIEEGPRLPSSFLRLSLETEKYNTMKEGVIIDIIYDKDTNMFKGPGIELLGMTTTHKPSEPVKNTLSFQNLHFIPFEKPKMTTIDDFLSLCGQLVAETFGMDSTDKNDRSSQVTVLVTEDVSCKEDFKKLALPLFTALYQELFEIDLKYVTYEQLKNYRKSGKIRRQNFVICGDLNNRKMVVSEMANLVDDLFILSFQRQSTVSDEIVEITAQKFDKYDFVLWKKKIPFVGRILKIEPYSNEHWLEDFEEDLHSMRSQVSVIVQWHSEYAIDTMDIINKISSIDIRSSVKYIYISGKDIPDDIKSYKKQLEKGLVMNVYKNGKWGSLRNVEFKNDEPISNIEAFLTNSKKVENVDVEYVTIPNSSTDTKSNSTTHYFEYSGTNKKIGKKVTGLAKLIEEKNAVETIFEWPIPSNWPLEDAVTVPSTYIKVYYALLMKGNVRNGSQICVYSGHTFLGEAAIAVALSLECFVYTSVDNINQQKLVDKRFSNSSRLKIFNLERHKMDVEILRLTHGVGIDIIVNANTEKQLKESSRFLRKYGSILQLCDSNVNNAGKMGMEIFLKSTKLCSVMNVFLLEKQPDVCTEIHKLIADDIKRGIITPFKNIVYRSIDNNVRVRHSGHESSVKTVIKQNDDNQKLRINNNAFICDTEKSYVIFGSKDKIWLSIASWLLKKNAKKLIIVDTDSNDNYINQYEKRFSMLMQKYKEVTLMYLSSTAANNIDECSNVIKTANNFGEIDVVFCLSLNSDQIENINYVLRQQVPNLRQFVCLQCDSTRICESRLNTSLPALNVIWDCSIDNLPILLQSLCRILHNLLRINSSLLYIFHLAPYMNRFEKLLFRRVDHFLPKYSEIKYLVDSFSSKSEFERCISKCPIYDTRSQLFPVFILPGLHSHRLHKLTRRLMYPTFCAKMSSTYSSASHIALSLLDSLRNIQPQGPYTIIGETWSGAIAIELTSLLEEQKERVQLILLEGIPKDMQDALATMGRLGDHDFIEKLTDSCFNGAEDKEKIENVENVKNKYLELIQRRLMTTYHYTPKNKQLRNKVIAVKLMDRAVLDTYINFEENYNQGLDLKILNMENYEKLLDNDVTATIINDNILFQW